MVDNFYARQIYKSKSMIVLDYFANRVIYFWNKLYNQIKNSNDVKELKIELDEFINNVMKKNSRGHFCKGLDELLNRI